MHSFKSAFTALTAILYFSLYFGDTTAAPTAELAVRKSQDTPAAPHWVTYTDSWISGETGPPDVSLLKGYNTYILSFWLSSGPADQAAEWISLTDDARANYISSYHAAGIKIMVSAFGATESPTSAGEDPVTTANNLAAWVKTYGLDGVDVDYEDFSAFNGGTTKAVDWLVSFTKQLRSQLPAGQYIITHAPVAPWFEKGYQGGGYLAVDTAVGSLIDWYNIQFYNQGVSQYTTCDNLLNTSGGSYPGSSVFEISANGVPLNKLVIGKPAVAANAPSGGYVDPATLSTCVSQAAAKGWKAGVMNWEYPDGDAAWISTVRGTTFAI